jgi:hypothetical protein
LFTEANESAFATANRCVALRSRKELTMDKVRVGAAAIFAVVLLMIGGVLNIIYGIAAIGNSSFFVHDTHYVFASLKTWGWITLIIGIVEDHSASVSGGAAERVKPARTEVPRSSHAAFEPAAARPDPVGVLGCLLRSSTLLSHRLCFWRTTWRQSDERRFDDRQAVHRRRLRPAD